MLKKSFVVIGLFLFLFPFVNSISGSSSSGGVGEFTDDEFVSEDVNFFEDLYSGETNAFIFLILVFVIIAGIIFWKSKISKK
tara:strand:+ start:257 stop:502 length:246 start_codon:yes stop_codon:yes gene_type:complete